MNSRSLSKVYREVHNILRNVDGLQPQEAFEELLKYLFFKQEIEDISDSSKKFSVNEIRNHFETFLDIKNSWSDEIWKDKKMHLSDDCLEQINEILCEINFKEINLDIRSQAIKEFLTPEIRKGLGIFLTPDNVVSTIIEYVNPEKNKKVLDPSCGTGTFLIEYLKYVGKEVESDIYGFDKNPRMLLLADLNFGHIKNIKFNKKLVDSLKNKDFEKADYIFTNPPFGVNIDSRNYDFNDFYTCQDEAGYILKKQSSEIVFIEKNIQMLKEDGVLAIVIPKSIATNHTLQVARKSLDKLAYIEAILSLPSETFATTGTQASTLVLFIRKINKNRGLKIKIPIADVKNVGYDATGRVREGSQLKNCAKLMKDVKVKNKSLEFVNLSSELEIGNTFEELSNLFINQQKKSSIKLKDLCSFIGTGKTPARKDYSDSGSFIVKVGNLSGSGINWDSRDRNFISHEDIEKRKKSTKSLLLKTYDILLTSSAHNPTYIAKKSDIFISNPTFLSKDITFSGEVMLVRPNIERINPFTLLAFLRDERTIGVIQNMVRGQTAHLHSRDLMDLYISDEILSEDNIWVRAGKLLEKQSNLMLEINEINNKYKSILKE